MSFLRCANPADPVRPLELYDSPGCAEGDHPHSTGTGCGAGAGGGAGDMDAEDGPDLAEEGEETAEGERGARKGIKGSVTFSMRGLVIQVMQEQHPRPDWELLEYRVCSLWGNKPVLSSAIKAMLSDPEDARWKGLVECIDVGKERPIRKACESASPNRKVCIYLSCMRAAETDRMGPSMKEALKVWEKVCSSASRSEGLGIMPPSSLQEELGIVLYHRRPTFIEGDFKIIDAGEEDGNVYYQSFLEMQQYGRLNYDQANMIINRNAGATSRTYFLMANNMIVMDQESTDGMNKVTEREWADTFGGSSPPSKRPQCLLVGHVDDDGRLVSEVARGVDDMSSLATRMGVSKCYHHPQFGSEVCFALSSRVMGWSHPSMPTKEDLRRGTVVSMAMSVLQKAVRYREYKPAVAAINSTLLAPAGNGWYGGQGGSSGGSSKMKESRCITSFDRMARRMIIVCIEEIGPCESLGALWCACVAAQSGAWFPGERIWMCIVAEVASWCDKALKTHHHSHPAFYSARPWDGRASDLVPGDGAGQSQRRMASVAVALACIAESGGMEGDVLMLKRACTALSDGSGPMTVTSPRVPEICMESRRGSDTYELVEDDALGRPLTLEEASQTRIKSVLLRSVDAHSSSMINDAILSQPRLYAVLKNFVDASNHYKRRMLEGVPAEEAEGIRSAKDVYALLQAIMWHSHSNRGETDPRNVQICSQPFLGTVFSVMRKSVHYHSMYVSRGKMGNIVSPGEGEKGVGCDRLFSEGVAEYNSSMRSLKASLMEKYAPKEECAGEGGGEGGGGGEGRGGATEEEPGGEQKEELITEAVGVADITKPTIDLLRLILTREVIVTCSKMKPPLRNKKFIVYTDLNHWMHICRRDRDSEQQPAYQFPLQWLMHLCPVTAQDVAALFLEEDPWAVFASDHEGRLPTRKDEDLEKYTGFDGSSWVSGMRHVFETESVQATKDAFKAVFDEYVSSFRKQSPRSFCPSWWCGDVLACTPTYEFQASMIREDASAIFSTKWKIVLRRVVCMGGRFSRKLGDADTIITDSRDPRPFVVGARFKRDEVSQAHDLVHSPFTSRIGMMAKSLLSGGTIPSIFCMVKSVPEFGEKVFLLPEEPFPEVVDCIRKMVMTPGDDSFDEGATPAPVAREGRKKSRASDAGGGEGAGSEVGNEVKGGDEDGDEPSKARRGASKRVPGGEERAGNSEEEKRSLSLFIQDFLGISKKSKRHRWFWKQEDLEGGFSRARQIIRHMHGSGSGTIIFPMATRKGSRSNMSSLGPVEKHSKYDPVAFALVCAVLCQGTSFRASSVSTGRFHLKKGVALSEMKAAERLLMRMHEILCCMVSRSGRIGEHLPPPFNVDRVDPSRALDRVEQVGQKHRRVPYPYQVDTLKWMCKERRCGRAGFVTLKMGWGKTYVFILYFMSQDPCVTFVMCPSSAWNVWVDEALGSHIPRDAFDVTVVHGNSTTTSQLEELTRGTDSRYGADRCRHVCASSVRSLGLINPGSTHLVVCSYNTMVSMMRKNPVAIPGEVVADEGDLLRYLTTLRHSMADAIMARIKWICTASLLRNGKKDLASLLNFIDHPMGCKGFVDMYLGENEHYINVVLGSTSRRGESNYMGDLQRMPDIKPRFSPSEAEEYRSHIVSAVKALRARGDVGSVVGSLAGKCVCADRKTKLVELLSSLKRSGEAYLDLTARAPASDLEISVLRAVARGELDEMLHSSDEKVAMFCADNDLAEPLPVQTSTWQRVNDSSSADGDFMDKAVVIHKMVREEASNKIRITWRPTEKACQKLSADAKKNTAFYTEARGVGWADEYLDGVVFPPGGNVLVFTRSLRESEEVIHHLRSNMDLINSAGTHWCVMSMDSPESVRTFQSASNCIGVARIREMSRAVTLTAAKVVVIYGPLFNHNDEDQACARADRLGQTDRLVVCRLVVGSSVEEHIVRVAEIKRREVNALMNASAVEAIAGRVRDEYLVGLERDLASVESRV